MNDNRITLTILDMAGVLVLFQLITDKTYNLDKLNNIVLFYKKRKASATRKAF